MTSVAPVEPIRLPGEALRTMLLWGAVGGMLPTLSKIAGTFGANFDAPTPKLLGVCVALVLYAIIGAVVSRAMANPDMKQSLFAGIAAPAIVVGIIAGATDSRSTQAPEKDQRKGVHLIGVAHAQTSGTKQSTSVGNVLSVYVVVRGDAAINDSIRISATLATGSTNVLKNIELPKDVADDVELTLDVPLNATSLLLASSTGVEAKAAVKKSDELLYINITPKTSVKQDLVWALGGRRVFEIGKMTARASVGK